MGFDIGSGGFICIFISPVAMMTRTVSRDDVAHADVRLRQPLDARALALPFKMRRRISPLLHIIFSALLPSFFWHLF